MHTAPFRLMPTRLLSTMDVNRETPIEQLVEDECEKQKRAALTKFAWRVINTGVGMELIARENATQEVVEYLVDHMMGAPSVDSPSQISDEGPKARKNPGESTAEEGANPG